MNFYHDCFLVLVSCLAVNSMQLVSSNLGLQVKDFNIEPCNSKANYKITLHNINVRIGVNPKILVSGIFTTVIDLDSPIKADLEVYHKVLFWVKLPCEFGKGSCTYDDLCTYSVPANKTCPSYFMENNVPCRCPIAKGTYTIPESIELFPFSESPLVDGAYKGTINIYSNSKNLGCYNFNFNLADEVQRLKDKYLIREDNHL